MKKKKYGSMYKRRNTNLVVSLIQVYNMARAARRFILYE